MGQKGTELIEATGTTRHGKMPYFEVLQAVIADVKKLREWAKESIFIAHTAKSKKEIRYL